jgi:hypothetical protein
MPMIQAIYKYLNYFSGEAVLALAAAADEPSAAKLKLKTLKDTPAALTA